MTADKERDQRAIEWLLESDEPGIRLQARRDLLREEVPADADEVLRGPKVAALLKGQQPDGGFGAHPYAKWRGAHWRLVSLVDLGVPDGETHAIAAANTVLDWLTGEGDPASARQADGRYRVHASQEGNALAACARLGLAEDLRVGQLANALLTWQWPDGGWNCDRRPEVTHSSFYESITPLLGLAEYARTTGDERVAAARDRAAEFFLGHNVFQSHRSGRVGDPDWLKLQYPLYHYYDILHGLRVLARAGALPDSRASEALRLLRDKQHDDGRWYVERRPRWLPSGKYRREAVDWDRAGPSEMLTLNALRVLHGAH